MGNMGPVGCPADGESLSLLCFYNVPDACYSASCRLQPLLWDLAPFGMEISTKTRWQLEVPGRGP
jgi:hypothetical protein